jgi:hypothetical protein
MSDTHHIPKEILSQLEEESKEFQGDNFDFRQKFTKKVI